MYKFYKGINQEIIQEINRTLIISQLRKEKMCSRVQLANFTGLKQATVTNIMKDFMDWRLVKEVGFLSGNKGRRSIGVTINTDTYRVIGVRLARKYFSVGLFDLMGEIKKIKKVETSTNDNLEVIFENIIKTIEKFIEENKEDKILAIGVALPGPFIKKKNRIALITEVENWKNIIIDEELKKHFQIPVFLEHDANAGAYSHLWHLNTTYNNETLIYIAAGQGIGAGIIIDGEIYKGTIGTAGEIGHTTIDYNGLECACGNKGCLEKYSSSIALTKAVNASLKQDEQLSFAEISKLIKEGDERCVNIYKEVCKCLGIGIINLINSFNPNMIIIGDEMTRVEPDLMYKIVCETVKKGIISEVWDNLTINMSDFKEDSILSGAGIVAINEIFSNPEDFVKEK